MAKKIATLSQKRAKSRPLCYVDSKGHLRCRKGGRSKGKGSILAKSVVDKKDLQDRKAGRVNLFTRGRVGQRITIWKGKGLASLRKGKKRRGKRKAAGGRRKLARRRKPARRRSSRRCPTFRKKGNLRSALACLSRGKGSTVASKRIYNRALRRLKKSSHKAKVRGKSLAKHRGRVVR